MMRSLAIAVFSIGLLALTASAAEPSRLDVRTFDIRPVAPTTPALKYRLRFDPVDRYHGNAALAYMQAAMFVEPDNDKLRERCLDDLAKGDDKAFAEDAKELLSTSGKIFDELDLAGRRESCDWEPPIRERGVLALLPHLNRMRQLAGFVRIRSVSQLREGKIDDAIDSLRLGYELSAKTGTEPVLISGLVALSMGREMNLALVELMNRPDAPTLYWPLARLRRPLVSLAHSMQGERFFVAGTIPALERVRAGETLTSDEYRDVLRRIAVVLAPMGPDWKPTATAPSDQD